MELKDVFDYAEQSLGNVLSAAKIAEVDGKVPLALIEGMYHEMQRLHKERLDFYENNK